MNQNTSAAIELKRLLGEGNVLTGEGILSSYFAEPVVGADMTVVKPRNEEQLADVAAFSNDNGIPLFSVRRKTDGGNLNGRKGILVDLSLMNQIKSIDRTNLTADIYGGVTFEQLSRELAKDNLRLLYPVSGTSPQIVRSYMDRDVLMGEGGYRHPNLTIFHAMMANGQKWVSGSQQMGEEGHADFREDQGPQYSPIFGASEDIFGIPYYSIVYTYPNREERRLIAFSFDDLAPAKDLLYKISRAEWCFESFAANARYLAVILAGGKASAVPELEQKLSPWTVVVTMEHYRDLVDLWERYIREAAIDRGAKAPAEGIPAMCEKALEKPWNLYDRDFYRGRTLDVNCYDYFRNVPDLFGRLDEAANSAGYKAEELGKIVVPVYFGASAYCEANLYFNGADASAAETAGKARLKAYEALLDGKSFIDRPRDKVAEMVYSKMNPGYVDLLKFIKKNLDPKGLLNPDQLLEGV